MKKQLLMEEPIIESSGTLPIIIRIRDIILTILMWLMYIWFMRNFFFFMSDVFSWAYHDFDDTAGYESFRIVDTLIEYFKVILVMGLIFIGWALYNKFRFRNKKRRQAPMPIEPSQLATSYGLKTEDLVAWQDAHIMVMHHEADGRLNKVDIVS